MAVLKIVNVHIGKNATLKGIINYILKPKKTEDKLVTGFGVDIPQAFDMMMETKKIFGKLTGRQYYHLVQSLAPNENITPAQAHEVGIKFVEACKKLWGVELILATHFDRKHIHNHFVYNSVNYVDGHKFHITRKELAEMKELQNQICIKMGFSPAPKKGFDMYGKKRQNARADNSKTFHVLKKANAKNQKSYLMDCAEAIKKSLKLAKSKDQFISLMKAQGFETEWKDNKKHIVFKDIKREQQGEKKCKTRLYKLAQFFPELKDFKTKEDLLNGIIRNTNNESDNRRPVVAANHSDKSESGTDTELIDFNSGYEEYSARVDKERDLSVVEEYGRYSQENDERERNGIKEEKRSLQQPAGSIEGSLLQENISLRKQSSNDTEQSDTGHTKGYSR